ncbi:hypothetical protein DAPPUDRAFT_95013 [Daphnia pulex]|uniref:Uncharacterized protein n=1 Tax=Daphnia pulex TaxID=6669 RepID=E9FTQ2_DAPPU|nr:hypothetical protein DAPPUDRAFT_95013 [Daphnia pulex]|eukprot:EFX89408.1 hypothetical protein DAPPUDRAFT_95013 [Daphnia pulex]
MGRNSGLDSSTDVPPTEESNAEPYTGSLESGDAKIKPRHSSSASDYYRSGSTGSSVTFKSPRDGIYWSPFRCSSIQSSTDCSTVKSGGVSYSLSKLPSPGASLSPASPSRGVFDFNNVDPFGYELNLSETSSYVSHRSRTLGLLNLP